MKSSKLTLTLIALMLVSSINAQPFETRKYIDVTGSAEMNVEPDEIELAIVLVEYEKNGKKVKLDDVNDEFFGVLKKNRIDTKSLTFDYYSNDWWYRWNNRKETSQTKSIRLKLSKETNLLKLVEDLDKKWVESLSVSNRTNKEIQKFRKEVKIEALKAAKEKASYLLKSVGEEIGTVLWIEETPEYQSYWNQNMAVTNVALPRSRNNAENAVDNVTLINLRYEVRVRFEIK